MINNRTCSLLLRTFSFRFDLLWKQIKLSYIGKHPAQALALLYLSTLHNELVFPDADSRV